MPELSIFQWIAALIAGAIPIGFLGAFIWWFADEDGFKRRLAPFGGYLLVFEIALYSGLIFESLARALGGSQGALSTLMLWVVALFGVFARKWLQRRQRAAA